jgi:hypothetical protein
MRITLDGSQYELIFAHHLKASETEATQVRLEKIGTDWVVEAYALKAAEDQYSKFIGRKVALTRLVKQLPRGARKQIWTQYWAATGKGHLNAQD